MNLKKVFLFLLAAAVLFPLCAQQGKDVVLVVDVSSSMFSYYNEVGTYLSGPFLAENVSTGDTLHIISYGSRPRFEIARRILGEGDIETAAARIWLLYPLEPNSDPAAAINYAEQYVRSIQGGRPKKVYIVSSSDLSSQASAAASRLKPNAEMNFIRAGNRMGSSQPPGTPSQPTVSQTARGQSTPSQSTAGQSTASSTAARSGTTDASSATGKPSVSDTGGAASAGSSDITPPLDSSGNQTAQGEQEVDNQHDGNTVPPDSNGTAGVTETTESTGEQGSGTTGKGASTAVTTTGAGTAGFSSLGIPLPLLIGGALLLLLLLLLFIIFRMRNLQSSPKKVMSEIGSEGSVTAKDAELLNAYASQQAEASLQGPPQRRYHYKDTSQVLSKPAMLNIFVEEQSIGIGRRNIHALKKGATYSVGGGNSDFLIFLVKFPPKIGRLYFDGTNCTFTPLKKEFFPDIGSAPVAECIGKTIRILSSKNYEVFFHFEPYKDPLIIMNQLLNSIRVPEPPTTG